MPTLEEQTYKFSELSDSAKEKEREWWREQEAGDFDPCYEPYETAAAILGISLTEQRTYRNGKRYTANTIHYSGFWSQGDGASFIGSYKFLPGCCEKIREEFGTDETLHSIADRLSAMHCRLRLIDGGWLEGKITQHSSRYSHSGTMDAVCFDKDSEELDAETCDEFRDLMREFADWIYEGLKEDYDSCMSDEAADEALEANDYEFEEDGECAA